MTLSVAIANAKGGVAKTTTSLSLGAALVEQGCSVLLVDLDPHANLTLYLGVKPNQVEQSVADMLMGGKSYEAVTMETQIPDLDLIPSNLELTMAETHLTVRQNYETILRQSIGEVNAYDYTIMDCPPTLGTLTRNALTTADLLIIPTQPEYFSTNALRDMLQLIRNTRIRANPGLYYRILVTMLDRRNRIHTDLAQHIRTAFGDALFESNIEIDTRLRESAVIGEPINLYAPKSRAATQYSSLAEELRQYTDGIAR